MKFYKISIIIFFLCFISLQAEVENEILNLDSSIETDSIYVESVSENSISIIETENNKIKNNNFFIDAIYSSFKLIINFDNSLFYVVLTSLKVSLIAVVIASIISIPLGVIVALNNFRKKFFNDMFKYFNGSTYCSHWSNIIWIVKSPRFIRRCRITIYAPCYSNWAMHSNYSDHMEFKYRRYYKLRP